jgi:uncharacterized protein (DUF362 family)/NAD-dependent dihydropyrimidine dehydrogenase PreA subunit
MTRVVLVACASYDQEETDSAVERGLSLLGGVGQFVAPDQKVLLKPNLLYGVAPETCTNTHPSVFSAVAKQFLQAGAELSYGDHPGFGTPLSAARKSGIAARAEELGIPLADFKNAEEVDVSHTNLLSTVPIATGVLESDVIVSLPKLKTHAFQKFTGCVKNQFGCIPGLTKPRYHVRFPDANEFAEMLLAVNNVVSPKLYIMDGVYGMEGNGPRGGTPVRMGLILMGTDPIAIDATVCRLIDLKPEYVPTIKLGAASGYGVAKEEEIELAGDPPEQFARPSFSIDRMQLRPYRSTGALRFAANLLVPKPTIDSSRCIRCGVCVEACPAEPKALQWADAAHLEPPVYKYSNCIRCYCCQEMCPKSAVYLRKTVVRRLMDVLQGESPRQTGS